MDKVDVESLNHDMPASDDAFITVSRQAYCAMEEELMQYRALYGALPGGHPEMTVEPKPEAARPEGNTSGPAMASKETIQSDAILSILSQDENAAKADVLDDLAEGILTLSGHEVIRHYGFKRMKMNHR